jgi:hypothetical protein
MTTSFKYLSGLFILLVLFNNCKKKEYSMGELTAPTDVVINTEIVGADATHPNGDGSGDVKITLSGKGVLSYKIDYDANDPLDLVFLPTGATTRKYTKLGLNTYRITAVAYGKGATTTTVTKEVTVQSNFIPDATIVSNLTGTGSKTWVVQKDVSGHFGVGPWTGSPDESTKPVWWSAPPNDKAGCCNCFYTAKFTFTKAANGTFSLQSQTPDGAFTKTGALAGGLPGIPGTGGEGCYPYAGGTSAFTFVPSVTSVPASASTKTAILLSGNNTFIGYGAVLKEYEILSISDDAMYLRVQGTETGNAWYLKLIPQ